MTRRTRFRAASVIIACVVLAGFLFMTPHAREVVRTEAPKPAEPAQVVALRDAYRKGVHSISGTLDVPDACATVSASAETAGTASSTETIIVALVVPTTEGVCLQVPSLAAFAVKVSAPAGARVSSVTVNGRTASTTGL